MYISDIICNMALPRLHIEQFDPERLSRSFYVNRFSEHLVTHHAHISHPHKHAFYITVLMTQGKGTHLIDFTSYTIEPNCLFFLQPEQVHHWEFTEAAEGWIIFHSEDFLSLYSGQSKVTDWLFFGENNPYPKLQVSKQLASKLIPHFQEIYNEANQPDVYTPGKIYLLTQLLYTDISRKYSRENLPPELENREHFRYREHFTRFTTLVNKLFATQKQVAHYANLLGMTPKHLHRICTAISGKKPALIIAERIILEAKRSLVSETQSIQEIAFMLGFETPGHFHSFFRKYVGLTPKNFRNKHVR